MDNLLMLQQLYELLQLPQRILRDRSNPMEDYTELQFMRRYRFSKNDVINYVLPMVADALKPKSNSGCPVPELLQLLCALRYFASGTFQIVNGDTVGLEQSTISRIVKKVAKAICRHYEGIIKFPANLQQVQHQFYAIKRFPRVIGAIDCTHIPIQSPKKEIGERYRNRKGWFSMNVQAVCGPDLIVYDLVTRWPGSVHDSRIFENSAVKLRVENGTLNGVLVGDSGYGQTRYLYTPVLNPITQAENRYNRAQILTRNPIERTFGVLKRRFACLAKKSALDLNTVLSVITACVCLHNMCMKLYSVQNFDLPFEIDQEVPVEPVLHHRATARDIKNAFINAYFNH